MLKIRLQRIGRKNQAAFRVVVVDSHASPKAGKNVELLGSFNPHTDALVLNLDRAQHWISKGAQLSDRMHNMMIASGAIKGKKINVLPRKRPIKKEQGEASVVSDGKEALKEARGENIMTNESVEEGVEVSKEEVPAA